MTTTRRRTSRAPEGGRFHWPTIALSLAASALVSALILAIGMSALYRSESAKTAESLALLADRVGAAEVTADTTARPGDTTSTSSRSSTTASISTASSTPASTTIELGPATATSEAAVVPGLATGAEPTAAPGEPNTAPGDADGDANGDAAADADGANDAADAGAQNATRGWQPSSPLPAYFRVTDPNPSLDDLNAIIHFLVATNASDEAKAANLEAGASAVIVPRTVYNLGLFRAPLGWKELVGPVNNQGDRIGVTLHSGSAGRPDITVPIEFVYDGNWKLANSSVCQGVRTVGLPIHCNA